MKNALQKLINRETILYGVVGIGTSILNVLLFQILQSFLDYKVANIITLVVVKVTAYILNKNLVFHSHADSFTGLLKEILRFIVARGATMLIDYFGLIMLVDYFGFHKLFSKCAVTILVIVLNYIIGKKHVFIDAQRKTTSQNGST